jgi:hypothetical protein
MATPLSAARSFVWRLEAVNLGLLFNAGPNRD